MNSQPSFYAIIPAYVRYCKELEPNAKLLYGEITALCNREGYCWASNEYFAELYDVDVSTIKRWLVSLKENGFINVEVEKEGFKTTRKISISEDFQKSFATAQKCAGRQLKNEPVDGSKMPPIIIHRSNTTKKETIKEKPHSQASFPPLKPFSFSKEKEEEIQVVSLYMQQHNIAIDQKDLRRWFKKWDAEYIIFHLVKMLESKTPVKSAAKWMEFALKKNYMNPETNRKYAEEFKSKYKWLELVILKSYCKIAELGKELYYNMTFEAFKEALHNCYRNRREDDLNGLESLNLDEPIPT